MILIPGTRWSTRPACASRPLSAVAAAPAVPAPSVRRSTRPVCATRRLHDAPAVVADIKWGATPGLFLAA